MTEKRLFIFLEGPDDERLFTRIVVPVFAERYRSVETILYAGMKRMRVDRFLQSISRMGHEYILVADIDREPSVKAKKRCLTGRFEDLKPSRVIVVIQEIESWYLAGLDTRAETDLGLHPNRNTDHITKEEFNNRIPVQYQSRIAFMSAILAHYSTTVAQEKNQSFRFFSDRYYLFPKGETEVPLNEVPLKDVQETSEETTGDDTEVVPTQGAEEHNRSDPSGRTEI